MKAINVEIKARSTKEKNDKIRSFIRSKNGQSDGVKHQIDTYFHVPEGRLKLREFDDQMQLVFYKRDDKAGPKQSDVLLYSAKKDTALKEILSRSMGVWRLVDKQREIFFIDNVKFHLDEVEGLGTFMEIEAIDQDGSIGVEKLTEQCSFYLQQFGITNSDLLERSYSDMTG